MNEWIQTRNLEEEMRDEDSPTRRANLFKKNFEFVKRNYETRKNGQIIFCKYKICGYNI